MKRRQGFSLAGILLSISLLCPACGNLDGPKPEDKFYCKVNGKHWRPNSDGDFKAHTLLSELTYQGKTIYIRAIDNKIDQTISMIIADTMGIDTTNGVKTFTISVNSMYPNSPPAGHFYKPESEGSVKEIAYSTSATHKGTFRILSIEHDPRRQSSFKMKAEFEFTAVSPSGDVVKITDGNFNDWVEIRQ